VSKGELAAVAAQTLDLRDGAVLAVSVALAARSAARLVFSGAASGGAGGGAALQWELRGAGLAPTAAAALLADAAVAPAGTHGAALVLNLAAPAARAVLAPGGAYTVVLSAAARPRAPGAAALDFRVAAPPGGGTCTAAPPPPFVLIGHATSFTLY